MELEVLAGNINILNKPRVPFDDISCEFVNELSRELRKDKKSKLYPDVLALSYWCRKSNITKMRLDFRESYIRIGLGYAFHITPSNAPTNFAYSFIFGLLSGNSNVPFLK